MLLNLGSKSGVTIGVSPVRLSNFQILKLPRKKLFYYMFFIVLCTVYTLNKRLKFIRENSSRAVALCSFIFI